MWQRENKLENIVINKRNIKEDKKVKKKMAHKQIQLQKMNHDSWPTVRTKKMRGWMIKSI